MTERKWGGARTNAPKGFVAYVRKWTEYKRMVKRDVPGRHALLSELVGAKNEVNFWEYFRLVNRGRDMPGAGALRVNRARDPIERTVV